MRQSMNMSAVIYLASCGAAGDWLMQYAPGDFGIVAGARFSSVYRVQGKRT
jgi:hypothetical protein